MELLTSKNNPRVKSAAALLRYYGFDKLTVTRESAAPHSVPSEIKDK